MADIYPESRVEEILVAMINGEEYTKFPESRIEALLIELLGKIIEVEGRGAYEFKGSVDFDELPETLTEDMAGWTYNMAEAFTTDERFVDGSGKSYPQGTNVSVANVGTDDDPVMMFDVPSAFVDVTAIYNTIHTVVANLASTFSDQIAYHTGDLVVKDDVLYKFTSDHAAGEWNPSHASTATLASLLIEVYTTITQVSNTIPTQLSQLTDDSTHRFVTDTEKTAWNEKQSALTFDDAPTASSNNPVKSGGIYDAIDGVTDVKETAESSPYLYRNSGGAVRNVVLEKLKKVIGASVAWNQLVQNGNFANGTSNWSLSNPGRMTYSVSNNKCTVTITDPADYLNLRQDGAAEGKTNHVCFLRAYITSAKATTCKFSFGQNGSNIPISANNRTCLEYIIKPSALTYNTYAVSFNVANQLSAGDSVVIEQANAIDLTQLLGTAIADYIYSLEQATSGSGIAKLKEWGFFTKDYYAYNTGALQSVKTSGKKCVGKNLLPMTVASIKAANTIGTWSGNKYTRDNGSFEILTDNVGNVTGINLTSTNTSNNSILYIPFTLPAGSYILSNSYAESFGNLDTFLQNSESVTIARGNSQSPGQNFTLENSDNVIFHIRNNISSTDNKVFKPMIRLVSVADSSFESYVEKTYPLSNIELRGIFKLDRSNNLYADGDEYTPDGNVKRKYNLAVFNGGEAEEWTTRTITSGRLFEISIADMNMDSGSQNCIINGKFSNNTQLSDNYSYRCINAVFSVHLDDVSTVEAFKTWLASNPINLIYAKSTATTETAEAYSDTILVDADGTEEFIDERTVPVPVGHESEYSSVPDWMDNDYFKALEDATYKADILRVNKVDNSVVGTVENGTTASKAYAVGEHFIRNKKFCTAIASIASGAAFTLNTNYVEGSISDNLVKKANFTATTSASGNALVYNGTDKKIVGITTTKSDAMIIPFLGGGGTQWWAKVVGNDFSAITNTEISGTYYYI